MNINYLFLFEAHLNKNEGYSFEKLLQKLP